MFALSLGLVGGPLANGGSANHLDNQYPPGARRCIVDVVRTPPRGIPRTIHIQVRCPTLGININITRQIRVFFRSEPVYVGTFPVNSHGELDITVPVPDSLKPGSHHVELYQAPSSDSTASPQPGAAPHVLGGQPVLGPALERIPLTLRGDGEDRQVLVGANASSAGTDASSGGSSSKAPLTAAAIGLVGIGATGMVLARRRRNATSAGDA